MQLALCDWQACFETECTCALFVLCAQMLLDRQVEALSMICHAPGARAAGRLAGPATP